ncbi:hypothetical protein CQA53_09350 [Helicobacter didelphidarum]|uniref:DUF452 domain-containing protein n=1 Tax=Helicobacter didelphidarum TaxID=2040648 RepID=A0A3D8ICY7_9HELI|nr:pimeloyl-ACP methyl esterase BioG family protein [Helicobacter didelphidarum]RDU62401.1 hypothetical protein CQA53_09350 [Helicobacter didelphidarum]
MKTYFLRKNTDSKDLILFFAGFGAHYSHFLHLDSKQNVLICYDYRDFLLDLDFSEYENITLIAFSMGVCIASIILESFFAQRKAILANTNKQFTQQNHNRATTHIKNANEYQDMKTNIQMQNISLKIPDSLKIQQRIAINGTNFGIHQIFGIHPTIFKRTMQSFSLTDFKISLFMESLDKTHEFIFETNSALKDELSNLFLFIFNQDSPTWQISKKENEINIASSNSLPIRNQEKDSQNIKNPAHTFLWNKALISKQDKIFPPNACLNFFQSMNTYNKMTYQCMQEIHECSSQTQQKQAKDCEIILLDCPHFPFFAFKTWEEICQM